MARRQLRPDSANGQAKAAKRQARHHPEGLPAQALIQPAGKRHGQAHRSPHPQRGIKRLSTGRHAGRNVALDQGHISPLALVELKDYDRFR